MGVCKCTKKLNDDNLKDASCRKHSHKHIVVQNALKNIYLLHLSGAYLIKNLQKITICNVNCMFIKV
ncbi:hypothetical protein AQUCO_04200191v1 [Aquilegia coerulea]|uniref:Uncharacterized protein n=1 Tax=Aquilegia coerulea TaxID=218851 RepID=A0A2G5CPP6_AQUCA|nr:hypothetical protein AQUCO_04200191v1 [Aquilegia coerulea]